MAGARRFRARVAPPVRLARVRARRRAPDALPNNYGDLPLHWTYIQHLARGAPFWPENPILTHERLRYPIGVDLLTAVFVQLGASLPVVLPGMGLVAAALAALALRRWGGAFAVAAFLFSGGLAGPRVAPVG